MKKNILSALLLLSGFWIADAAAAVHEVNHDPVGESRSSQHSTHLRRPKYEFREREDGLQAVLPALAKEELLGFEDRLLAHRKSKQLSAANSTRP